MRKSKSVQSKIIILLLIILIGMIAIYFNRQVLFNSIMDNKVEVDSVEVSSGSFVGSEYFGAYALDNKNGQDVNFWIKNTGKVDVKISINNREERVLEAGRQGHISMNLSNWPKDYVFKAASNLGGGKVKIDYNIVQK